MSKASKQSFMHVIELTIIGLLAFGAMYLFGDNPEIKTASTMLLLTVLGSFGAKYTRANPNIDVKDWVNDVKE